MKKEKLRKLISFLSPKLMNIKYEGLEYLPKEGPVLITTNHLSQMDIPVLFLNPVRLDLTALVTDKYKKNLFIVWFVKSAEGIWIDRTRADFAAFQAAFEVFKQGRALGISPEGTRSKQGELLEGKAGSILLATKMDVPIVPVGLAGTESVIALWKKLRKPSVVAQFGPMVFLWQTGSYAAHDLVCQFLGMLFAVVCQRNTMGFIGGIPAFRKFWTSKRCKFLPLAKNLQLISWRFVIFYS